MSKEKSASQLVKGHWFTIKGRLYKNYSQFAKNFDKDGEELIGELAEKAGPDHPFIWLRSRAVIRPKDTRLQPYYMYGRFPGKTRADQMRYLHETRGMSVENKINWLVEQGYPKYGDKKSSSDSK